MTDTIQIDLSPDACALIEFAVRGARAEAVDDLATCRSMESLTRQASKDSETYAVGQRIATADNLIDVLELAMCISVTLPSGSPTVAKNGPVVFEFEDAEGAL